MKCFLVPFHIFNRDVFASIVLHTMSFVINCVKFTFLCFYWGAANADLLLAKAVCISFLIFKTEEERGRKGEEKL